MKRQSNLIAVLALLGLFAVMGLIMFGAVLIRQQQDASSETTLQSIYAQQTGAKLTLTVEIGRINGTSAP